MAMQLSPPQRKRKGIFTENKQFYQKRLYIYTVSQKTVNQFSAASVIFWIKTVKHWPTLIIFGMQHQEET